MNFKDWSTQLNEIQRASLPYPIEVNGYGFDAIDFRFEDWKRGHPDGVIMPNPQPYFSGEFSIELDDGNYLNFNTGGPMSSGSSALSIKTKLQPITINKKALHREIENPYWFDFAELMLGGSVVKEPLHHDRGF